ncbi:hypothetical protein PM082_022872 [Marasmius tenuissimus]|nr:hypothetical protein PM082_022872 [Marasmius tenuissimus]
MPVYVIPVLVTRAFPAVKATTVDLFTIQSTISSLGWNLCSRLPDSPQTKATFASYPQRHHCVCSFTSQFMFQRPPQLKSSLAPSTCLLPISYLRRAKYKDELRE